MAAATRPQGHQQSFDELGTPLTDVTFCVIDIETTGASPKTCGVTEIAAAKFLGGRCVGTFQTLVNPGCEIPPEIVYLTGITQTMVGPAPKIDAVLPSLLEFVGTTVIVGHNVRFDLGFLNAALTGLGYQRFTNRVVDTCTLARRLVRTEVLNCKLGTLAAHFGFANQPTHRALDDVRATADLLHLLLERAAGFGVLGLDDLIEMPSINRHPQSHKLHLTNALPRSPGVYVFKDRTGNVIYVGKATNLRARVRSYFGSDDRRKIGPMLEILHKIDHLPCATPIEAAILEIRLIQRYLPRYNRQAKFWTNYAYVRIIGDKTAKATKVATTRDANGLANTRYIGPFASIAAARTAGVAVRELIAHHGDDWAALLDTDPSSFVAPLHNQMRSLAQQDRFEEAALVRDRGGVLARALDRQFRIAALAATEWFVVEVDNHTIRVDRGRLRFASERPTAAPHDTSPVPQNDSNRLPAPVERKAIDEMATLVRFLEQQAVKRRLFVVDTDAPWLRPEWSMPRFAPREPGNASQTKVSSPDSPKRRTPIRRSAPTPATLRQAG